MKIERAPEGVPKFFHMAVCDICGLTLVGPTNNEKLCDLTVIEHDLIEHAGVPTAETIGFDHFLGNNRYV